MERVTIFLLGFIIVFFVSNTSKADTNRISRELSDSTSYFQVHLKGSLKDIITEQPIIGARIEFNRTHHITDSLGQFEFTLPVKISDSITAFRVVKTGYKSFYHTIQYSPEDTIIKEDLFIFPLNLDSLVLGWKIGDFLTQVEKVKHKKQRVTIKRDNYIAIQIKFLDDIYFIFMTQINQEKWHPLEIEGLSKEFIKELNGATILGTGLLFDENENRNKVRYLGKCRETIVTGKVE